MPFISMLPIIQNTDNAVLSSLKAMPSKDITSDGTSTFVLGRMDYVRGYAPGQPNFTASSNVQKKWIGGNRDASQVIASRRINSIANGSLNAAQMPMSFMSGRDPNAVRNALNRVRNQGSVVPPKVWGKNLQ
jgi:hypothetical protein